MRITKKQMKRILTHKSSPFIRAIGFLRLRFASPPGDLWAWFEPFLRDRETFRPTGKEGPEETMGSFVHHLLSKQRYFGTLLPRIPVPTMRRFRVQVSLICFCPCDDSFRRRWNMIFLSLVFMFARVCVGSFG